MKNIPLIKMEKIHKVYDNGVIANKNVSFEVKKGEIHALAGENGAGKSTLMKILFGLEKPSSGNIYLDGENVKINSPFDAGNLGIGMVHQNFMLIDELTIAENIFLGNEKTKRGILNKKETFEKVKELATNFGLNASPNTLVSSLTIAQKQKVEILKALSRNPKILILDEPTAVLTPQETEEFFRQLESLKNAGHTLIIITHKLNEIKEICDRITIMRNGEYIGMFDVSKISEEEISRKMVGRDVILELDKEKGIPNEEILSVNNLTKITATGKKLLENISFKVFSNEIVCVCGVEGNGQSEMVKIVTGSDKDYDGDVFFTNIDIKNKNIKQVRKLGLNHISEDRNIGLNSQMSIAENLISTNIDSVLKFGLINKNKMNELAEKAIEKYLIKAQNQKQKIEMLSGGNAQKVVIARETIEQPKLLIADQPTRGVDVGAIEFIHKKIVELRDKDTAVLLISSDLSEILNLADRILVFYDGNIVANIKNVESTTEEELGLYMLGLKKQEFSK